MDKLDRIEIQLTQLMASQASHNSKQEVMYKDVTKIRIALYGDKELKLKGVLQELHDREVRIKSLEDSRSRIKWTLSGIAATTQAAAIGVYEYFKDKI